MKKNKIKTTMLIVIIILVISILGFNIGAYAYSLSATEVSYTKKDGSIISVKAALDELRDKQRVNDSTKEVGDEVTVGGEQFYVLEWLEGSNVATLLSKYNLNQAGTAQQESGNTTCIFSSTNYWADSFLVDDIPNNLNDIEGYKDTDAIGRAKNYGRSKGAVSSRLLSFEEAKEMQNKENFNEKIKAMYRGPKNTADLYYLDYWTGSAYGRNGYAWYVSARNGLVNSNYMYANNGACGGVRPVITILKAKIS